ncbi:MAG: hypothetical protein KDE56_15090, partial [Anaerolineales bacterium]|nr:hypothetical protein [Anaerolineales bacterium]
MIISLSSTQSGKTILIYFALLFLCLYASPSPVLANQNFVVNSAADSADANPGDGVCAATNGDCTVRAAVEESNALPGLDTIFVPGGDPYYFYTNLTISDDLVITGDSADFTRFQSILNSEAQIGITASVEFSNFTIGGFAAPSSGAVSVFSGDFTANNMVFISNSADYGGAIYVDATARLLVENSYFENNTATNYGGAIMANGPSVAIYNSTFINNEITSSGSGGQGGALWANGDSIIIDGSTFLGNDGATSPTIEAEGRSLSVTNSTFFTNAPIGSVYAAIRMIGGQGIINNSTFWGETTTLAIQSINGTIEIQNSIVAGRARQSCSNITDLGHNLTWPSGGSCPGTAADPKLGAMAENGGPTPTMALLAGSAAIDAGNDATCISNDQRGVARPQGARCDIGAFETAEVEKRETSQTLSSGVAVSGTASRTDDVKWYRLNVPQPGSVVRATLESTADYDLYLFAPRVDEETGQLRDIGNLVSLAKLSDIAQLY